MLFQRIATCGRDAVYTIACGRLLNDNPTRSVGCPAAFRYFFRPTFTTCDLSVFVRVSGQVLHEDVVFAIRVGVQRANALTREVRCLCGLTHVDHPILLNRHFHVVRRGVDMARLGNEDETFVFQSVVSDVVCLCVFRRRVANRIHSGY